MPREPIVTKGMSRRMNSLFRAVSEKREGTGDADEIAFARYAAAVARVDGLIEAPQTPGDRDPARIRARAEARLARVRRFLAAMGDPFERFPIVHVGGTSGKGSTAAAIAAILDAAGYRVGLHISPYLQVATEKLQVAGRLIGPDAFADLVSHVFAAYDDWRSAGGEALTYGEIWVALVAQHLANEAVDIGVIEVGAGGRFDLTNVVSPVVSVVTSIGFDHTATLGTTLAEIAWHKAGIIKPGAVAVTGVTGEEALAPILAEASRAGTTLHRIAPGVDFAVVATGPDGTLWRETLTGQEWPAAPGGFQAANAALAVAAVRRLADRGFPVSDAAIAAGLSRARLPGRVERMPEPAGGSPQPRVMLDGAHNPQKIGALVDDLDAVLPRGEAGRRVGVLGVLEAKDFVGLVGPLVPVIDELVVTSPRVLAKAGLDVATLAAAARAAGFHGPLTLEPNPGAATEAAMARMTGPDDAVLVTGSLYLVGNVRGRWYPERDVLRGRTSWPSPEGDDAPPPPAAS